MANHAEGVSATCIFEHSGSSYGENLAAGYDSPDAAITAWYDEKDQYNGDFSVCGIPRRICAEANI